MTARNEQEVGHQALGGASGNSILADEEERAPVEVSIVVPTMRRQALLPSLVERLFGQVACESINIELVIVDNCPQQSARPTVIELRRKYGARLRYVTEERPGVSHVRNTGVRAARGSLIAFIDDDEIPCGNWLLDLLASKNRHAADVVLGPVYPDFEISAATRDPLFRRAFTQDSDRPTGALVEPRSPFRVLFRPTSCYRTMATNNALVDRRLFNDGKYSFSPELTHLGGEDLLFFHNLYLSGKKIIWCREAAVFERIHAERSEISYLLKRRFRDGQITSATCLLSTPKQLCRLLISMGVGLVQVVAGSGLSLVFVLAGSRRARIAILVLAAGMGKILWMRHYHLRSYGVGDEVAGP